jgi:hypothetical protein
MPAGRKAGESPTAPRTLGRRSRRGAAVVVGTAEQSALAKATETGPRWRAWVVSPRRGSTSGLQKASALSKLSTGFPCEERLQCPKKHLSPTRGKRVGGVSGRPAREADRSDPVRARGRGGGKHPVFGKASSFAGGRWNVGLGRSGTCVEVSSSAGGRTGDSGCSSGAEEGNVVSSPPAKREHPTRGS